MTMKATIALAIGSVLAAGAGRAVAQDDDDGAAAGAPTDAPAADPADGTVGTDGAQGGDASAGDEDGQDASDEHDEHDQGKKHKKHKKHDKHDKAESQAPDLELGGRIFARATAYDDDLNPWIGQLTVPSTRLGATYHWKKKLTAKISFEVRGSVKDAYLEVPLATGLHLRAGRFKLPASAIERTSTWTLPTVDRTIVSDVLGGGIGVVGRRSGLMLTWAGEHGLEPTIEVGVAQSTDTTGVENPRQLAEGGGVTATARASLRPVKGVKVGAFGQSREVNYRTGIGRYWAGGLDVVADLPGPGIRLWADAIAGTSHLGATTVDDDHTPFVTAHAIAAWRHGGRKLGKHYLEPFVAVAYVNPTTALKQDAVIQVAGGVAGGMWKRWRGQLEVAWQDAGHLRPASLGGVDIDLDDRRTVMLQLGTGF